MKIGILTFHHSLNYGAMLQAFCLQSYLESCEHSVEFIDYNPPYLEHGGTLKSLSKVRLTRAYLKSLYLFSAAFVARYKYRLLSQKFAAFKQKYLYLSTTSFSSFFNLSVNKVEYDLIVIGSDQVWNPSDQYGLDKVYFGDPLHNYAKRIISYAASFGSINRIEPFIDSLPSLLRNFDDLSVREYSAQQYLSKISIDACVVPDPTFLVQNLNHFSEVSSDLPKDEQYAFFYILRDATHIHSFVDLVSSQMNIDNIYSAATPWRRWRRVGVELELSPFEFIGAIQHSEFTVSNSFHGVVSSILTSTNFIAIELPGSKAGLSSRISDLLEYLGLSSRLVAAETLCDSLDLLSIPIDWSTVREKILNLRNIGQEYLTKNYDCL